jgi:PTH2 family peptidyl-tRNA hydrolase
VAEKVIKQVIVMRRDLKMRRGKEVAQGGHASMKFLAEKIRAVKDNRVVSMAGEHFPVFLNASEEAWLLGRFTKICVKVNSEEELLAIHQAAQDAGLTSSLVQDAGKTEFKGVPTYTCLAIGPDEAEKIDVVTQALKLY